MREVEVDRFIAESPAVIERALSPERVVEWEGSFTVETVEQTDDGETLVTVTGPGVGFRIRFEQRPNGYYYAVAGAEEVAGPFDHLETWLTVEPENEGSRVRLRSAVSLNLPLPFADRLAAWKRRGELRRALDRLVDAV